MITGTLIIIYFQKSGFFNNKTVKIVSHKIYALLTIFHYFSPLIHTIGDTKIAIKVNGSHLVKVAAVKINVYNQQGLKIYHFLRKRGATLGSVNLVVALITVCSLAELLLNKTITGRSVLLPFGLCEVTPASLMVLIQGVVRRPLRLLPLSVCGFLDPHFSLADFY